MRRFAQRLEGVAAHLRRRASGFRSWGLRQPDLPPATRLTLIVPLFERPISLLVGHLACLVMTMIALLIWPSGWPGFFFTGNVVLLVMRLMHLARVRHIRERLGDAALPRLVPYYIGIGLVWAALNGLFVAWATGVELSSSLSVLALVMAMGICSGISGRNAGTPRFARAQIVCWIVPVALGGLLVGSWNLLLSLLIVIYLIALHSIVNRAHADLLAMLDAQTRAASLAARFDAALSNMSQGLILYDPLGRLLVVNRRFCPLLGLLPASIREGQAAHEVAAICLAAGVLSERAHLAPGITLEEVAREASVPGVLDLADGRSIAVTQDILADGSLIASYEDITERRRNEARIAHMARHDALTDLPNRVLFRERLDQAVAWLGRGEGFGLACLDLDHFKVINDTLGHAVGDLLLKEVAARLLACVREVDTVARLGGDEFAIILPTLSEEAEAAIVAHRLIETVSAPYLIEGFALRIGVSIGMAMAPRDGATPAALLMHGDLAMYAAKSDGRGRVRVFAPAMSERLATRRQLERDLDGALERGEFELLYQPIIDLQTDCVVACEALLRWNHPSRGLILPDMFLSLAEESGLTGALGEWALQTACRHAADWPALVRIAMNLSPLQFRTGRAHLSVAAALAQSGLPAHRLELEITEAAMLHDIDTTLAALSHLRATGVRLVMDEFGTGFSPLSYLHRFSFDKIKIDQSFTAEMECSESAATVVRAIATLGASLNLVTIADGVETIAQREMLRGFGYSAAQGQLFSPPQPQSEIARRLLLPLAFAA